MLRSPAIVSSVLLALTVSTGAIAQSYYDDQACRQYADAQVAPLRGQASGQAVGSALLGAGLGAAIGGAAGGGRGAGIGAASGALAGTGVGAVNAQNAAANLQQQYNAYYSQCMASRTPQPPGYAAPAPAYGAAPGYGVQPGYGAQPGHGAQPSYGAQPGYGYGTQPSYGAQPGYGYGAQPSYPPAGASYPPSPR